jgi:hypothetical protein
LPHQSALPQPSNFSYHSDCQTMADQIFHFQMSPFCDAPTAENTMNLHFTYRFIGRVRLAVCSLEMWNVMIVPKLCCNKRGDWLTWIWRRLRSDCRVSCYPKSNYLGMFCYPYQCYYSLPMIWI